jgi:hypothetical protein
LHEDLIAVGCLANTTTLVGERGNGQVKKQKTNGHQATYFKNKLYMQQCLFKQHDIFLLDQYIAATSDTVVDITPFLEEIEMLCGLNVSFWFNINYLGFQLSINGKLILHLEKGGWTLRTGMFVSAYDDNTLVYGRILTMIHCQAQDANQPVDIILLKIYEVQAKKDKHSRRSYIKPTDVIAFFTAENIHSDFSVVPQDLDWFIQRNNEVQIQQRAHWTDWESGDYKGKLVFVP